MVDGGGGRERGKVLSKQVDLKLIAINLILASIPAFRNFLSPASSRSILVPTSFEGSPAIEHITADEFQLYMEHGSPSFNNEPYFDLLGSNTASSSNLNSSFPQNNSRRGEHQDYEFGGDDVLPSSDYQPIRRSGSTNSASRLNNSSLGQEGSLSSSRHRQPSSLAPSTVYMKGEPSELWPSTSKKEIDMDAYHTAVVTAVERTMKKYADNLLRVLEGMSGRLSQLESVTQGLEHSVREVRVSIANNHGEADGKLRMLSNHLSEVHRTVQLLRDKQEIVEAHAELVKLQLSKSEGPGKNANSETVGDKSQPDVTSLTQQQEHRPSSFPLLPAPQQHASLPQAQAPILQQQVTKTEPNMETNILQQTSLPSSSYSTTEHLQSYYPQNSQMQLSQPLQLQAPQSSLPQMQIQQPLPQQTQVQQPVPQHVPTQQLLPQQPQIQQLMPQQAQIQQPQTQQLIPHHAQIQQLLPQQSQFQQPMPHHTQTQQPPPQQTQIQQQMPQHTQTQQPMTQHPQIQQSLPQQSQMQQHPQMQQLLPQQPQMQQHPQMQQSIPQQPQMQQHPQMQQSIPQQPQMQQHSQMQQSIPQQSQMQQPMPHQLQVQELLPQQGQVQQPISQQAQMQQPLPHALHTQQPISIQPQSLQQQMPPQSQSILQPLPTSQLQMQQVPYILQSSLQPTARGPFQQYTNQPETHSYGSLPQGQALSLPANYSSEQSPYASGNYTSPQQRLLSQSGSLAPQQQQAGSQAYDSIQKSNSSLPLAKVTYDSSGVAPSNGYGGSVYRVSQPVSAYHSVYPRLPSAQPVSGGSPSPGFPQASATPGGGGNLPMNRSPVDEVIERVASMGFTRDQVRSVVRKLTENGQSVDLNVVLDKLMNGGMEDQSQRSWYGR